MKTKQSILITLFLIIFIQFIYADMPISKQAVFIEASSSAEVMLEATGVYKSNEKSKRAKRRDVDKYGVSRATDDAKKSAVYYVLFSGTDPLLRTSEERTNFENHSSYFFDMANVSRYINYEDDNLKSKVKLDDGQVLRISKVVKVNKENIIRDLQNFKIIERREDIAAAVGFPQIMVIPEVKEGENPVELLKNDNLIKHAASVIESHLTAKQYEVIVPQQLEVLNTLNDAQQIIVNRQEDIAYKLALAIGSDVYITFAGTYEDAGYGTKRYAMIVRAYETTTGRLLGTETGYSQGRKGETTLSIEEAMNDAVNNVLSRVLAYWSADASNGIQYKLVISINPAYSEDDIMDIQDIFMDTVDEISKRYKENIATNQTLDYLIWCDVEQYPNSRSVFRDLRRKFNSSAYGAKLSTININRKMILLKID